MTRRHTLVKACPGAILVLSGIVTSIGLPAAAWSHEEIIGGAVLVTCGRVNVTAAPVGVSVVVAVAGMGVAVARGVCKATCVRRASTVWNAWVTPIVGVESDEYPSRLQPAKVIETTTIKLKLRDSVFKFIFFL